MKFLIIGISLFIAACHSQPQAFICNCKTGEVYNMPNATCGCVIEQLNPGPGQ